MTNEKLKISLTKLRDAISRLDEALKQTSDNILAIDGTIQRFEFVFEQCWKTLQKFLAEEGIEAGTPREVLTKAYQSGWIKDEDLWLRMLKDRNETSHTYDEKIARRIYGNIPGYLKAFKSCHQFLTNKSKPDASETPSVK